MVRSLIKETTMKKILNWMMAAILVISGTSVLTSCKEAHAQEDNPVQQVSSEELLTSAVLTFPEAQHG